MATSDPLSADNPLRQAANKVSPTIASSDSAFAGSAVDHENNSVIIFRVGGEASGELREGYASTLYAGMSLVFKPALLSTVEYAAVDQFVRSNISALSAANIPVTTWGQLNGYDKPYVIQYEGSNAVPATFLDAVARFGAGNVVFQDGGKPAVAADRNSDSSPFYGGGAAHTNAVVVGNEAEVAESTTGFTYKSVNSGHLYASEAWHSQVQASGTQYFASNNPTGRYYLGSVSTQDHDQDVAFVDLTAAGKSGSPTVWSGGYPSPGLTRSVVGENLSQPQGGDFVCEGGASSGIHCDIKFIVKPAVTYSLTDQFTGHTAYVKAYEAFEPAGSTAVATGDSGGPVFSTEGASGAIADGQVSAAPAGDEINCPRYVYNNRPGLSETCATSVYIVSFADIVTAEPALEATGF